MFWHILSVCLFLSCHLVQGEVLRAVLGDWYEDPDVESDPVPVTDSLVDVFAGADDVTPTAHSTAHPHNVHVCDDIAIIGGGIAGSYTAWRLKDTNQSISVYEYSDRIGGRLHTSHMTGVPGFNAELGGMRYHEQSHPLLNKTIHALGLTVQDFPLGYGASNDTLMYLRGMHMRYDQLGGQRTPYHLKPRERKPYRELLWDIFVNNTDYLRHKNVDKFHLKTHDGIPLYKQSIQAVFAKSISRELTQYIKDVNSFLSDFGTTSAAYALPASDPITPGESSLNLLTVKEGMNEIPKRLLLQFKHGHHRHHIRKNHHLTSILKQQDGIYQLNFANYKNHTVRHQCAKKVILAINRLALEKLEWSGLKQPHIWELVTKSVRDAKAVKFFLAYDHPWWKKSHFYADFAISDTPLHRTYDFGTLHGSNISVLNAVYTDNDVTLWEELIKRGPLVSGTSMHTVTQETVHVIHRYLSEIYAINIHQIPKPVAGIIGIWNSYPIGGAWQEWLPGYIFPEVEKAMVKPSANDDVFVASNAFNSRSLSFWSESALEAAELVLKHFQV